MFPNSSSTASTALPLGDDLGLETSLSPSQWCWNHHRSLHRGLAPPRSPWSYLKSLFHHHCMTCSLYGTANRHQYIRQSKTVMSPKLSDDYSWGVMMKLYNPILGMSTTLSFCGLGSNEKWLKVLWVDRDPGQWQYKERDDRSWCVIEKKVSREQRTGRSLEQFRYFSSWKGDERLQGLCKCVPSRAVLYFVRQ